MTWLLLGGAIAAEVTATMSLRASEGFTRLGFTVLMIVGYVAAFGLLGIILKQGMPVGVAYGIWAATGVAAVAILAKFIFGDALTVSMMLGIALIAAGVLLVEVGRPH
ncbi:small multidrug resistance pump [Haloactinopolyspora alba]|uniref:Small multidrug resistance pump n=1 Tax=Haloactinopolyspora alba TaxID=648780 RepID=A0A2P8DZZ5_9ACTN|nr:multidrug efflux SMR transporter [Haloactinopolyspora alba]PSL02786.1 small multidrug resistance pump [Haloactinopolyspora alba]